MVMQGYADYIRQETLSEHLVEQEPEGGAHAEKQKVEGMEIALGVKQVPGSG
jgi:hypothetical protein